MNKIEIFKPFGEAFELTKRILFQPFDLKKWCVIGFAAFLANLGGGGYNFNYNPSSRSNALKNNPAWQDATDWVHSIPPAVLVLGVIALVIIVLALIVVFAWLRTRGVFMFIDCIVKNRGAIAEPWREFRLEGNSLFLFQLVIMCGFFILAALLALPLLISLVRGGASVHAHNVFLISLLVLWIAIVVLLGMAWAVVAQLMVIIMYRRRCGAVAAFRPALALIGNYPGEFVLYWLFLIVLAIGTAFVACLATCVTCCLTALPYVGTVILLPLFVCLRGFNLLFVRQFGPEYDAWGGEPPIAPLPAPPPAPPLQPAI